MIDRYSTDEIQAIFSLENQYKIWQSIEVLAAQAQYEIGELGIKKSEIDAIVNNANFTLKEIEKEEKKCHHDLIAFLTVMSSYVDGKGSSTNSKTLKSANNSKINSPSRWLHYGLTSNDIKDTCLNIQICSALDVVIKNTKALQRACVKKAKKYKYTVCVGRSHGIYAEPYIFGLKFASWAMALDRSIERLRFAKSQCAVGAISGAIGSYSSINPKVEKYVCKKLKLQVDPISTQIVSRDRHANAMCALAVSASVLENIATQIRLMQQSDCLEVEEPFSTGQKGSSAMPHKRNPIVCERICGLARIVKANSQASLDNVALWHERDISHSSVERVALADSFNAIDYMLYKLTGVIDGLQVYKDKMIHNLNRSRGLIFSSKAILALVDSGFERKVAYDIVQENAMQVWSDIQKGKQGPCLYQKLLDDKRCNLNEEQLKEIFDEKQFLINTEQMFDRL